MWKEISSAPRDGTQILVARHNACGWEYAVVWGSDFDSVYPWNSDGTAYPEDRFDYWASITPPHES